MPTLTPDEIEARRRHLAWLRDHPDTSRDEPLSCASCGVLVDKPDEVEVAREATTVRVDGRLTEVGPVKLSRCPQCRGLRALALQILDAHRHLGRTIGNRADAVLEAALACLVVADQQLPEPDALTPDEASALVKHLSGPGSVARWRSRFISTPLTLDPAPSVATRPWAHLSAEEVRACRDGVARLLKEKVTPPVQPTAVACPTRGCLFCGLAAVTTTMTQRAAWTPLHAVPSAALGGRGRVRRLSGHLCPTCRAVYEEVRFVGPTLLEECLIAHRDHKRRTPPGDLQARGLIAWGALAEGWAANARAFGHVREEDILEWLAQV